MSTVTLYVHFLLYVMTFTDTNVWTSLSLPVSVCVCMHCIVYSVFVTRCFVCLCAYVSLYVCVSMFMSRL